MHSARWEPLTMAEWSPGIAIPTAQISMFPRVQALEQLRERLLPVNSLESAVEIAFWSEDIWSTPSEQTDPSTAIWRIFLV